MSMHRFALAAVFCAAMLAPSALGAQTYPSKPLHLILPYVPGGIIGTAGRNLALRLSESLGVSVVPENRPGAGGMVGADVVARATPDGYTVLLTDPALVSNPTLQPDVPYDLFKGLQAVSIVGSSPAVIVASLTLPVKTFADLCQSQSRQAQLRIRRRRHRAASRRRNDQARRRHPDDAGALSAHRRGVPRRHEREGAACVLEHCRRGPVHRRQPGAADRNHGLRAQPGLSRCADRRGVRPARLRRRPLDRHLRAGRAAAGGAGEAQRRNQQGAAASRAEIGLCQDRDRAARHDPRAGRGLHALGIREMEAGDRGRKDQTGIAARVHPSPDADVGSISHSRRTSPGAPYGYLSWPRYFFASASMCAAAPSSVTSWTRPRIWT